MVGVERLAQGTSLLRIGLLAVKAYFEYRRDRLVILRTDQSHVWGSSFLHPPRPAKPPSLLQPSNTLQPTSSASIMIHMTGSDCAY